MAERDTAVGCLDSVDWNDVINGTVEWTGLEWWNGMER